MDGARSLLLARAYAVTVVRPDALRRMFTEDTSASGDERKTAAGTAKTQKLPEV